MTPVKTTWNIYDASQFARTYTVRAGYVDEANPGTAVDLRPYKITMQGRRGEHSPEKLYDFVKNADSVGTEGLTITGTDFNELVVTLDSDVTVKFRGLTIVSDLRLELGGDVEFWLQITIINTAGVTR